jgi:hypothetical protein
MSAAGAPPLASYAGNLPDLISGDMTGDAAFQAAAKSAAFSAALASVLTFGGAVTHAPVGRVSPIANVLAQNPGVPTPADEPSPMP